MLELRPNCERCDKDLPPHSTETYICTFECTFCQDCALIHYKNICPNCGGNFTPRPIRPPKELQKHPPQTTRTYTKNSLNPPN